MIDLFEQPHKREKKVPRKPTPTPEREEKSTETNAESNSESKQKKKRQTGTVLWWRNGAGQILSDSGQVVEVHQVDLQFHGNGKRVLPENHQCEFEWCQGPMGEPRACEVSRSAGRAWVFNKKEVAKIEKRGKSKVENSKSRMKPPITKATEQELLMKYLCISETDTTITKGTVLYFNADLHYACIQLDDDPESEIFCDASGLVKSGSYMCVRRGVKVEFMKGNNAAGIEVATQCTGSGQRPIDNRSKRAAVIKKRKLNSKEIKNEQRKKQRVVEPDIVIPPKPEILSGKNPVSMIIEYAVCCKPKKIVTFKLVDEQFRTRSKNGIKTAFTYECRLDDEPVSKGTATTKRVAKSYAAFYAVETLSKQSEANKTEFERIHAGIPTAKKRPMPPARSYLQHRKLSFRKPIRSSSYTRIKRTVQDAPVSPAMQYAQVLASSTGVAIPYSSYRNNVARKTSYPNTKSSYSVSTVAYPYGAVHSYNNVATYRASQPVAPASSYGAPSYGTSQTPTAQQYQSAINPTPQPTTAYQPSAYASNIYKTMPVGYGAGSTVPSSSAQRMLNSQNGSHTQQLLQFQQPGVSAHSAVQSNSRPIQAEQIQVKLEQQPVQAEHRPPQAEPQPLQQEHRTVKQEYQSVVRDHRPMQADHRPSLQTEQQLPQGDERLMQGQPMLQTQRSTPTEQPMQQTTANWQSAQNPGMFDPYNQQVTHHQQPTDQPATYQSNHQPFQNQGALQSHNPRLTTQTPMQHQGELYSQNNQQATWSHQPPPQPQVQPINPSPAQSTEQLQNQQPVNYNFYNQQRYETTAPPVPGVDPTLFRPNTPTNNGELNSAEVQRQVQQPEQGAAQVPAPYPYQESVQTQQNGANSTSYPYQQQPAQSQQKGANNISLQASYIQAQTDTARAQQYPFY